MYLDSVHDTIIYITILYNIYIYARRRDKLDLIIYAACITSGTARNNAAGMEFVLTPISAHLRQAAAWRFRWLHCFEASIVEKDSITKRNLCGQRRDPLHDINASYIYTHPDHHLFSSMIIHVQWQHAAYAHTSYSNIILHWSMIDYRVTCYLYIWILLAHHW